MKNRKRLFFSFSLLCLFVLSFLSVGVVSAATYSHVSGFYGYGNTVSGGTTYDYTGDSVGVFFLDTTYVGETIDINSESSYTIYANYTVNGELFEGNFDVYYGEPTNTIAFSGLQYDHSEATDWYYSGYETGDKYYSVFANIPVVDNTNEVQYLGIKIHCYNYAEGISFNVYYLFCVDAFAGSPFATPTSFPLPSSGGWSGVDWIDGSNFGSAPLIVQMLLGFILVFGLPMCLVVLVPKAGMVGFAGTMTLASACAVFFLGLPVWLLVFTALGVGLMIFSLLYRG